MTIVAGESPTLVLEAGAALPAIAPPPHHRRRGCLVSLLRPVDRGEGPVS